MSTSGTYDFDKPKSNQLIDEAYERIGIVPGLISEQQIKAGQRSLNYIMKDWGNRGNNLWTVKQGIIGLVPGQPAYPLPLGAINIKTAVRRTSVRQLNGTPTSSSGIAANAFDGDPTTKCIQTAPNGFIRYVWDPITNVISMVGIQSGVSAEYTITCEYSTDGGANWLVAINIPKQNYPVHTLLWFAVPIPPNANAFQITETGGATLTIEELYFNSTLSDIRISPIGESQYTAMPQKGQMGTPTSYWVNRQIDPVVYFWQTPNTDAYTIFFTYWATMQDIGRMIDNAEVPARFLEPLTAALAYRLAVKEGRPPEMIATLLQISESSFATAAASDEETDIPLVIYGSYSGSRGYA